MSNRSTVPADVVSVESNSVSYLFYVNNSGTISSIKAPSGEMESEALGFYTKSNIQVLTKEDGEIPIKTHPDIKQIAVVAYKDAQGYQLRIYYAEEGTQNLKEICKTNNEKWFQGSLGKVTKFKLSKGSPISANVQYATNQLKVFACTEDDLNDNGIYEMNCWFAALGKGDWTRRRITDNIKY